MGVREELDPVAGHKAQLPSLGCPRRQQAALRFHWLAALAASAQWGAQVNSNQWSKTARVEGRPGSGCVRCIQVQ